MNINICWLTFKETFKQIEVIWIYISNQRRFISGVAATFNHVSPSSPGMTRLFKKAQNGPTAFLSVASPFTSGHISDWRQVTQRESEESERKKERWWKEVMLQREREAFRTNRNKFREKKESRPRGKDGRMWAGLMMKREKKVRREINS